MIIIQYTQYTYIKQIDLKYNTINYKLLYNIKYQINTNIIRHEYSKKLK